MTFDHRTFLSPFTWRYGSPAMRAIWSEVNKRRLWRSVWVALAEAQHAHGLVSADQLADLRAHADAVDIQRAEAIEAEIHHDLMAEVRAFAEQCPVGGGIIHLGATSADVEDNVDALRIRRSLDLLEGSLRSLLVTFAEQIDRWADVPAMGFTHIQPAEPTTVGYRLAQYGQDLLEDHVQLGIAQANVRGKGLKGAVGTSASYADLVGLENVRDLEDRVMTALDLQAYPATTQTYPRKQDFTILSALAGLAASLHKFSLDLRILQSPALGEWSEPFADAQVGSSAMPFKRNPVNAEKVGSLARYLATLPRVAWDDAAGSMLERTLDDSANRRVILPYAFLVADELLSVCRNIAADLRVDEAAVQRTLHTYGVFAATERVLLAAVRAGGDRQALHELLRQKALAAWTDLAGGKPNPLADLLAADPTLTSLVPAEQIRQLLDAGTHVGNAPERAREVAAAIRAALA